MENEILLVPQLGVSLLADTCSKARTKIWLGLDSQES